ncbi:MAG: MFS transporter [Pseudomonadota bacterium]
MRDDGTPEARLAGRRLLGSRRFTPLFAVQALGAFNDNVFKFGVISLLTFQLHAELQLEMSILTLTTIASGIFIAPFALLAPVAGQIADRVDKAVMMRAVKFAEILLMALAAFAFFVQDLLVLYVLIFLMGAQSAFFAPIKYGVLPQYLESHELVRGNGLIQAGTFFAILAGTVVGNNLILADGGVLWVSGMIIAVAAAGFAASLFAPAAPPAPAAEPRKPVDFLLVRAIAETARVTYAAPPAFRATLAISWFWFVGATFLALLPTFVKLQLGGDETVVTLLLAAFSIGVGVGAVLCGLIYRGAARVGHAPLGALGIAVFSADLAFSAPTAAPAADALMTAADFLASPEGLRVLVDFIGLAVFAGLYVTPLNAVYQAASPPAARGRVVAFSNVADASLMVVSAIAILIFEALALSPHHILGVVGATGLLTSVVVARWAPETWFGQLALRVWPRRGAGE